jgi:serine/threonine protein kinase/DNA-binding response OmpR family regulator
MDATAANIDVSHQDFLRNLAASRLLTDEELERVTAAGSDDVLTLAQSLLSSGQLTDFQLDAISQGRHADLRVGSYDILSQLGAGGMGTVFKARHRRMKRVVALKVLSAALCKDAAFVQRFQREVETVARLGHPNVVMAYDADEAEIGHFLVMEFVNGRDLASLVEKGRPLDVPLAVDCIFQAARGLAYAHAQGIVHRDVKPHNLLRDETGVVKVTDLGLARLNTPDVAATSSLTQAGGILGTVDYMPPEQAIDSSTTDHRADIYSLGCTLYFLLAGRPPFVGQSVMSILLMHRESAIPSLASVRPDVPAELDAIFNRMMAKSVADRFQSMVEVVTALEAVAATVRPGTGVVLPAPVAPVSSTSSSIAIGKPNEKTLVTNPPIARAVTILVVEPSRVQAGIIRKYLEAQDIVVAATLTKGAEALELIRTKPPDGIVSALHLADMTGIDLAKQVRAEIKEHPPGFVLISSAAEDQDSAALSKLNQVMFLPKPFSPEQLVHALNIVTGKCLTVKAHELSATAVSVIGKLPVDRSRLRVLIVDDSAAARTNQRGVLQGLGFTQLVEVADGAQAIVAAAREPFDLIVTDYNMPLMDGHALVSYLKQTPATAGIPVVMVTTETDPKVLDPVRKLGVIAVFEKAFPAAAVKPVLDKLF